MLKDLKIDLRFRNKLYNQEDMLKDLMMKKHAGLRFHGLYTKTARRRSLDIDKTTDGGGFWYLKRKRKQKDVRYICGIE
jgi:hypothetical protein